MAFFFLNKNKNKLEEDVASRDQRASLIKRAAGFEIFVFFICFTQLVFFVAPKVCSFATFGAGLCRGLIRFFVLLLKKKKKRTHQS